MSNKLKIQRDLNALHPFVKQQVKKVLADCKKAGLNVFLFEALRTLERQKTLKAKGRSQTLNSYHRLGLAIDLVFKTDKGNWTWNRPKEDWDKLAEIAERHGFSSGWRWKRFKDGPHMELRFQGIRTSTLYSVLNSSKSRKAFYSYVDGLLKVDSKLSKFRKKEKKVIRPEPKKDSYQTMIDETGYKPGSAMRTLVSISDEEDKKDTPNVPMPAAPDEIRESFGFFEWIISLFGGKK